MQNNDHKATLNKGTMSNKCYICDSILEAGVCVTNGHTFEADAEGNIMYTGRRPMHTIKKICISARLSYIFFQNAMSNMFVFA